MLVQLTEEWMGHPKGTKLPLHDNMAMSLSDRGVASILTEDHLKKTIDKAPRDKMVRGATKNK